MWERASRRRWARLQDCSQPASTRRLRRSSWASIGPAISAIAWPTSPGGASGWATNRVSRCATASPNCSPGFGSRAPPTACARQPANSRAEPLCADVTKTEVATPPTRAFTSHEPAEPSREKTLRVCYFGAYDREYVRNVVLINGLRRNGVEVVECHDAHAVKPWRLPRLVAKYARLARHVDAI